MWCDKIRGLAEGLAQPLDRVLTSNLREELLQFLPTPKRLGKCTTSWVADASSGPTCCNRGMRLRFFWTILQRRFQNLSSACSGLTKTFLNVFVNNVIVASLLSKSLDFCSKICHEKNYMWISSWGSGTTLSACSSERTTIRDIWQGKRTEKIKEQTW